jgi:DNA-binding NarL/FixJ family response regulator
MRVALADDAAVLRQGLARVLAEAGIEIAAQAGTPDELLAAVAEIEPDVAIVDIRMPPTWSDEGFTVANTIRSRLPQVGVLLLSQYVEADYALKLLNTNPARTGYLLKDRVLDVSDLIDALERIAAGGTVVDPALVSRLFDRTHQPSPLDKLTPREREVLSLMAQGLTDRGIAERLYLTTNTVETHIRHVIAKLHLPSSSSDNRRVQAVLTYLRQASPTPANLTT